MAVSNRLDSAAYIRSLRADLAAPLGRRAVHRTALTVSLLRALLERSPLQAAEQDRQNREAVSKDQESESLAVAVQNHYRSVHLLGPLQELPAD